MTYDPAPNGENVRSEKVNAVCSCSCHDPAAWDEYVVHIGPCCDRTDQWGYVPRYDPTSSATTKKISETLLTSAHPSRTVSSMTHDY